MADSSNVNAVLEALRRQRLRRAAGSDGTSSGAAAAPPPAMGEYRYSKEHGRYFATSDALALEGAGRLSRVS